MKTKLQSVILSRAIPTLMAIVTLIIMCVLAAHRNNDRALAICMGMIGGVLLQCFLGWMRKAVLGSLVLALACQPLLAQEAPGPQPAPGWNWEYTVALQSSIPNPNYPQDKLGPWAVGICVVGIAVVGAVIINKVVSACLNAYEQYVTNNAACGACPAHSPLPSSPEPVPSPSSPVPGTDDCKCSAPPAVGQPLPLRIEHSYDKDVWTPVAEGVGIGSEFVLPDTGYWRLVPLFLSIGLVDGVMTVHAPPGVLEFSPDLREWVVVGIHPTPYDLPAQAGFYRVRLN